MHKPHPVTLEAHGIRLEPLESEEEYRHPSPRVGALRWVRDEGISIYFDGEETIRRLRQQEERKLYVHSLVYALLRMSRLPGSVPAGDCTLITPDPVS